MAVLGVVESHAAVVVAELRCNQSHVGRASPRLGHVLLYTNQLLFQLLLFRRRQNNNLQWLWSERRWLSGWHRQSWDRYQTSRRKWSDCLCLRRWVTFPRCWTKRNWQPGNWMASIRGFVDVLPDLLVLEAVEEEDENALEAVQDGEDVGHGHGRLVQVEQAKCPRQTQEEHQDE